MYDETEEFLRTEMPSFDQFMEVLGRYHLNQRVCQRCVQNVYRLFINGFEICDRDMDTYGWGVYVAPRWRKTQDKLYRAHIYRIKQTKMKNTRNKTINRFLVDYLFTPSILDHSCHPTCVISFQGPLLTVTTLGPVHRYTAWDKQWKSRRSCREKFALGRSQGKV